MTNNNQWLVNEFHASVCIGAEEINRQLQLVYHTSDDLPKSWDAQDQTRSRKTGKPNPRWKISADDIAPPYISFQSDLENGANLYTEIKSGNFNHLNLDDDYTPIWQDVDLCGVVFNLQTSMSNVEHYAEEKGTLDSKFTVQSLYADMNNPKLLTRIDTSYAINDATIDTLFTWESEAMPMAVINIVSESPIKTNKLTFSLPELFWQSFTSYLDSEQQETVEPCKDKIIKAAHLSYTDIDNSRRSIGTSLLDMCQSDNYEKSYVFGQSKIPNVDQTTGPFAPRSLRFTVYKDQTDPTIGSLNWNIMVSAKPEKVALPKKNASGIFSDNPVPKGSKGTMLLSYAKLMRELVLKNTFDGLGLPVGKWDDPEHPKESACMKLKYDIDLDCNKYSELSAGTFSKDDCKIYPEIDKNRIRIDFHLKDVKWSRSWHDYIQTPAGYIGMLISDPDFYATWSGYFTFSVNDNNEIVTNYTQDNPKVAVQEGSTVWRVLADILSLGRNELDRAINVDGIEADVKDLANKASPSLLKDIIKTVQLPGAAVFSFHNLDLHRYGLRLALNYKNINILSSGDKMLVGDKLKSINGKFELVYQDDGNLVVYEIETGKAAWAAATNSKSPQEVTLDKDGGLTVKSSTESKLLSPVSDNSKSSLLCLQDNGELNIYDEFYQVTWSSKQ